MAGFFKKLFNRIVGKPTDDVTPVEVEQVALIALPVPEPEPVPVVEAVAPKTKTKKPAPKKIEKAKPVAKAPVKPAPEAKSKIAEPPPKKVETKKSAAKLAPPKKPEPKKPEPKKIIPSKKVAFPPIVKKVPPPPVIKAKIELEKPIPAPPPPPPPLDAVVEEEIVTVAAPSLKPAPILESIIEAPARGGWFARLKEGLSKSSKTITGSITAIFTKRKLDKETLQELEDTLIQADLGIAVSERIIAAVSHGRYDKEIDPEEVKQILAAEVAKVLKPVEVPFNFGAEKPFVILVVGVNGSGKTTTIGKLGSIAASEGFKVMFAACDTFRAAAVEQLTIWGKRIGAVTKSAPTGADAAGLAFDALKQAREDGTDILFIDTAGRLQNKTYLMDELDKVVRVIKKMDAAAPHAVLLVLDATTGQNALAQADVFTQVAGVTGLIMTKLDGTARGGILVAIAEKFKLPIHAIGVGESIDDLQPFDAQAFSRAIAGFED
jgi:fused signal recognition particle receptor